MISTSQLDALLGRACSFQQMHLYNRKLVDPYLLASHGLLESDKKLGHLAVCSTPHCTLALEFDTNQQAIKEDLELAVRDHDQDCQFYRVRGNLLTLKLFVSLGNQLYEEGVACFKGKGVWVQLNPRQILEATNIKQDKMSEWVQGRGTLGSGCLNFQLQQFMQLDPQISQGWLVRVSSWVFLALLGWRWLDSCSVVCRFCGSTRDVRNYISPSEFSLMKVEEGFDFLSSHRTWCCLVEGSRQYWKEILRQACLKKLEKLPSCFSRSTAQVRLRTIQRKAIEIYGQHTAKLNELRRKVALKRAALSNNHSNQQTRAELDQKLARLEASADQQKELAEKLIKSLAAHT